MDLEQVVSRIGARTLSGSEIKNTLPTYERLLNQIEEIRNNKGNENKKSEQTTNNISILGPRGSGKSSVLKTLHKYLTENKENNIVLSTIIPENTESHISLMACILGRLKQCVDDIVEKENSKKETIHCPPQKHTLEKKYNHLMESYLRIQEPYQKISIQQYSTESEYLRTMKNVFEASDRFGEQFQNFIDKLLECYRKENDKKDALLFIFIDDIDLSTYRCGDIVKTLLSYLSNNSIVTILAGDIDVFGEALTLNFLREDGILDAKSMDESYMITSRTEETTSRSEEKILNRKKQLAYEYLKKVMPPSYRHFVKSWRLEDRADFCPIGLLEDNDLVNKLNLETILQKIDENKPLLAGYFTSENKRERLEVLYNLFDETPRGLINVYSALHQLVMYKEKEVFLEKLVLETVVSSNYHLQRYKEILFSKFLSLGTKSTDSKVNFDEFNDWVENDKLSDKEIFMSFLYLDWAARLLDDEKALKSKPYEAVKREVLQNIYCNELGVEKKKIDSKFEDSLLENGFIKLSTIFNDIEMIKVHTLLNLPFPLALRYLKKIKKSNELKDKNQDNVFRAECIVEFMETIKTFYQNDESQIVKCLQQNPIIFSLFTYLLDQNKETFLVDTICVDRLIDEQSTKETIMSPLYKQYCLSGVKSELLDTSNLNIKFDLEKSFYVSFFNEYRAFYKFFKTSKNYIDKRQVEHLYSNNDDVRSELMEYYWDMLLEKKSCMQKNPFYNYFVQNIYSEICNSDGEIKELRLEYTDVSNEKFGWNIEKIKKQLEVILSIDKSYAWKYKDLDKDQESPVKFVKNYIENKLIETERKIIGLETYNGVYVDISCIEGEYEKFERCYKGVSETISYKCSILIENIYESSKNRKITTSKYLLLCITIDAFLCSRSWYGKREVRRIKEALKNATMCIEGEIESSIQKEYIFWFHCFCRYRIAEQPNALYKEINQLYTYNHLKEKTFQKEDDDFQMKLIENLQNETGLSEEVIQKIPELFQ